jgi:hypothetical protein
MASLALVRDLCVLVKFDFIAYVSMLDNKDLAVLKQD